MIFNFKNLFKSFKHAFKGLKLAFSEQNFKIQLFFGLIVLILMIYFKVRIWQAVVLILVILLVLILEVLNTIFEKMVDILTPRVHHYALVIKDLMAAAVLIASLGAIIIGLLILGPYFIKF